MPTRRRTFRNITKPLRVTVAALTAVVASASGLVTADAGTLTPSGTISLTRAGAVVENLDVSGTVYVRANNVTIRNSRVGYAGNYLIRIDSGVTGTVVERVRLNCGSTSTNAVAFGRYTARFVDVTGPCKNVFLSTGGPIVVESSTWNGAPIGSISPPTTVTPTTTTTVGPTTTTTVAPVTTTTVGPTTTTTPWPQGIDLRAYPNASNTGVPAGTVLTPSGTITVEQDGTVIDSMEITGALNIRAKNVVVRRSRVIGTGLYAIRTYEGSSALIEDTEIVGGPTGARTTAIPPYGSWTARRVNVHGFQDGLKVNSNQTIEDSWIHDMLKLDGSHNDAIQSVGGSNVRILRNRIEGPFQQSTSALILQADVSPLSNYVIEGNLLSGGTYTVYVRPKTADDARPTGMVIRNNVWVKNSWKYGPLSLINSDVTWEGNRFSDGSAFVRS